MEQESRKGNSHAVHDSGHREVGPSPLLCVGGQHWLFSNVMVSKESLNSGRILKERPERKIQHNHRYLAG
eukprot:scaffold329_cov390-Pavlova_lutheri.AAC.16